MLTGHSSESHCRDTTTPGGRASAASPIGTRRPSRPNLRAAAAKLRYGRASLFTTVAILMVGAAALAKSESRLSRPISSGANSPSHQAFRSLGERPSHNGLYRAAVVDTGDKSPDGLGSEWVVRITDAYGYPVSDGRIDVILWMPEAGRTTSARAEGAPLGAGEYRLSRLHFPAPAWWSIALQIEATEGTDSLAFNIVIPDLRVADEPKR